VTRDRVSESDDILEEDFFFLAGFSLSCLSVANLRLGDSTILSWISILIAIVNDKMRSLIIRLYIEISESPKRVSGRIFGPKLGRIFGRNFGFR